MEGDERLVDILENHSVEEFAAEMETCCRCRNGTFVLCEDSLEILSVLRSHFLLYPIRDRSLSEGEE